MCFSSVPLSGFKEMKRHVVLLAPKKCGTHHSFLMFRIIFSYYLLVITNLLYLVYRTPVENNLLCLTPSNCICIFCLI